MLGRGFFREAPRDEFLQLWAPHDSAYAQKWSDTKVNWTITKFVTLCGACSSANSCMAVMANRFLKRTFCGIARRRLLWPLSAFVSLEFWIHCWSHRESLQNMRDTDMQPLPVSCYVLVLATTRQVQRYAIVRYCKAGKSCK